MAILSEIPGGGPTLDRATITSGNSLLKGVTAYGNGGTLYTGTFNIVPNSYNITVVNNSGFLLRYYCMRYIASNNGYSLDYGNLIYAGDTKVISNVIFSGDSGIIATGALVIICPETEIQATATNGDVSFDGYAPMANKICYLWDVTQDATLTITPKT